MHRGARARAGGRGARGGQRRTGLNLHDVEAGVAGQHALLLGRRVRIHDVLVEPREQHVCFAWRVVWAALTSGRLWRRSSGDGGGRGRGTSGHAGAIDARGLGRVVSLLLHGQPPLAKAAVAELTPQLRFGGRLRHQPTAVCALERRNQTLDLIWSRSPQKWGIWSELAVLPPIF